MKDNRIEFPVKSIWLYFPQYNQLSAYYNGDQTEAGYLEFAASEEGGIDGMTVDEDAPVEYYTLQGLRVANPTKGQIVITRQGAKAAKSVIR